MGFSNSFSLITVIKSDFVISLWRKEIKESHIDMTKSDLITVINEKLLESNSVALVDLVLSIVGRAWADGVSVSTINKLSDEVTLVPFFSLTKAVDLPIADIENLEGEDFFIEIKYFSSFFFI